MSELFHSRLSLFPTSTKLVTSEGISGLAIGGCNLEALASEYGTPLYLYDRATLDQAVSGYKNALAACYPGSSGITYAGKAFLCLAVAQWAYQQGLWVDCTGAGELAIANAAGVHPDSILVHGVNKSPQDLSAAHLQAGTIVVDNLSELYKIGEYRQQQPDLQPNLWLRLRPGVAVETHRHRQTGQENSKFGMSPMEIQQAVRYGLEQHLPLTGVHFHQGSHFHDPAPLRPAIQSTLELLAEIKKSLGWYPGVLCTGGGWGISYHEDELPQPNVDEYIKLIATTILEECQKNGLPIPHLQIEPGRSLVARAGVAVYTVGTVKQTAERRWLLLDGGMADNPRPALYGAHYSALAVENPQRASFGAAWLGGPFCESGDILIENLALPDIQPGELIAIPVGGAYQLSMGSNYNGARKPAVVWLDEGKSFLIQRRETLDDLFRRDFPLVSR